MVHLLQMVSRDPTWATHKCPRGSVEQSVLLNFAVMGPDFMTFMKYKNGSSSAVTSSKYQQCVFLCGSSSSTMCHVWSSLKRSIGWFFFNPGCSRSVQSRCFQVLHLIPSLRSICHGAQFCRASQTWLEGSDPLLVEGLQVIAPHDRQPASVWLMASLSEIV